jgi:hypothetical protein
MKRNIKGEYDTVAAFNTPAETNGGYDTIAVTNAL